MASVKVVIEGREQTSDQLRALVDVRQGQPLTLDDLRSSTTHLANLGRFEDIRVLATPVTGGIEVTFSLVPLHPIDRVEFTGATGLPVAELQRLFLERYGGLLPGREQTSDIEDVVRDILGDEGFRTASVTAETVPTPRSRSRDAARARAIGYPHHDSRDDGHGRVANHRPRT